eukprot:GHVT01036932.1.p2 GENE.GHVT01036932.1~~GHVT01036932.1.p2  ORF type:complete len:160 (+),score=29.78 GHVT01036932.1:108-587(+)
MATNWYELASPAHVHTVKDVAPGAFIQRCAAHLKMTGKLECPKWVDYAKTAVAKELSPYDPDWLYVRAAAILRHLYIRPDCGVGGFRKVYGCKKRKSARYGNAPGHTSKAGGKIIRYILQQFERMKLVEQDADRRGRRLTNEGQRELDTIARQCAPPRE